MGKTITQKVKSLKQRLTLIESELKIAKQQLEHISSVDTIIIKTFNDLLESLNKYEQNYLRKILESVYKSKPAGYKMIMPLYHSECVVSLHYDFNKKYFTEVWINNQLFELEYSKGAYIAKSSL